MAHVRSHEMVHCRSAVRANSHFTTKEIRWKGAKRGRSSDITVTQLVHARILAIKFQIYFLATCLFEFIASIYSDPHVPKTSLAYSIMELSNLLVALSLLYATSAHSWLGCTDHDNKDILENMKANVVKTAQILYLQPPEWRRHRESHRSTDALVREILPRLATRETKP